MFKSLLLVIKNIMKIVQQRKKKKVLAHLFYMVYCRVGVFLICGSVYTVSVKSIINIKHKSSMKHGAKYKW